VLYCKVCTLWTGSQAHYKPRCSRFRKEEAMFDLQTIFALQQSRRIITELFEESRPSLELTRTAGEPKMKPLRFGFWKFPKFKRAKFQTRVSNH
jgi:hypothetical protein